MGVGTALPLQGVRTRLRRETYERRLGKLLDLKNVLQFLTNARAADRRLHMDHHLTLQGRPAGRLMCKFSFDNRPSRRSEQVQDAPH